MAPDDKMPSSNIKSNTMPAYVKRNPATKNIHDASRVFDITKIAKKATIPPSTSFIINNKISGDTVFSLQFKRIVFQLCKNAFVCTKRNY